MADKTNGSLGLSLPAFNGYLAAEYTMTTSLAEIVGVNVPAGLYLVIANATIIQGSTAYENILAITDGTTYFLLGECNGVASTYIQATLACVVNMPHSGRLSLFGETETAGSKVEITDVDATGAATCITVVRLGNSQ